jgi:hypothetical protein
MKRILFIERGKILSTKPLYHFQYFTLEVPERWYLLDYYISDKFREPIGFYLSETKYIKNEDVSPLISFLTSVADNDQVSVEKEVAGYTSSVTSHTGTFTQQQITLASHPATQISGYFLEKMALSLLISIGF